MGEYKLYCPDSGSLGAGLLYRLALEFEREFTLTAIPYQNKVRYRYPGESWQEVIGDDYSLNSAPGRCNAAYQFKVVSGRYKRFLGYLWTQKTVTLQIEGPIADIYIEEISTGIQYRSIEDTSFFVHDDNPVYGADTEFINTGLIDSYLNNWRVVAINDAGYIHEVALPFNEAYQAYDLIRIDGEADNCGDCTFTVFNQEEIVHQETRETCPEIQVINCQLDHEETEIITGSLNKHDNLILIEGKANILPPLISVLWANIGRTVRGLLFDPTILISIAEQGQNNPENCILLLRINDFNSLDVIAQICGDENCPLPIYEIECQAENDCPVDTCKVDCGDHYCCYRKDGVAIKTIAK